MTKEEMDELKKTIVIPLKSIWDTKEVAFMLGVTPECIRAKMQRKEIPYYIQNNKAYFKRSDVEAYQTEVRVASMAEIEAEASRRAYKR